MRNEKTVALYCQPTRFFRLKARASDAFGEFFRIARIIVIRSLRGIGFDVLRELIKSAPSVRVKTFSRFEENTVFSDVNIVTQVMGYA